MCGFTCGFLHSRSALFSPHPPRFIPLNQSADCQRLALAFSSAAIAISNSLIFSKIVPAHSFFVNPESGRYLLGGEAWAEVGGHGFTGGCGRGVKWVNFPWTLHQSIVSNAFGSQRYQAFFIHLQSVILACAKSSHRSTSSPVLVASSIGRHHMASTWTERSAHSY